MRDQHDTETADLLPAKIGRPCLDPERGPLTPAERAKRYRSARRMDRYQARALMTKPTSAVVVLAESTDAQLVDLARAYLVDLDVGSAAAKKGRKAHLSKIFAQLSYRYP